MTDHLFCIDKELTRKTLHMVFDLKDVGAKINMVC